MTTKKSVFIGAFITLAAAMLYQWGHLDGREGKVSGLIAESIAAESPSTISPVKARERDFYSPNSEDIGPDEIRLVA